MPEQRWNAGEQGTLLLRALGPRTFADGPFTLSSSQQQVAILRKSGSYGNHSDQRPH